ncbi:MAG: WxcM-like domain-containing protein [Bacteroidia bacterium]|nr:WxcM-like domain-containing protein [Bacteroidia bacterium]
METVTHIGPAFTDDRGEITNIFEGTIEHIAIITSKKGTVRANHYHKHIHQYIYLVSGLAETHCCEVNKPENKSMLLVKPGDLINTPPMIAHAQVFLEDSVFIALSTQKRHNGKYEEDTTAFKVVEGYINPELVK